MGRRHRCGGGPRPRLCRRQVDRSACSPVVLLLEVVLFSVTGTQLLYSRQPVRNRPAERGTGLARAGAHARDRHGRHRPLRGVHHGSVGRCASARSGATPGYPWLWAVLLTLLCGAAAGLLNALPITLLRVPPLIVTLGTYSLYRGLAEGLTGGVATYTGFPPAFLWLGQGYVWGGILRPGLRAVCRARWATGCCCIAR